MAAAVATAPDLSHSNGGEFISNNGAESNGKKKARESDRRRRRRSKKKNKNNNAAGGDDEEVSDAVNSSDGAKENADPNENKVEVKVEVEYVPEKADLEGSYLEDFKDVFEKFSFKEIAPTEEDEVKNEEAADSAKKKADSDSEEEQEDQQKKDGGVSNKKKKLERRMKIAELKQVCTRPDVVEVWDATATDPKLLVYLKSYRNTVPVPRHWCQKRKFLQELD